VTDSQGASQSSAVPVLVGNERPTIRFAKPLPGDFFDPQQPIRYELVVADVEDGLTTTNRSIRDMPNPLIRNHLAGFR
jgi:hypothetical protein